MGGGRNNRDDKDGYVILMLFDEFVPILFDVKYTDIDLIQNQSNVYL